MHGLLGIQFECLAQNLPKILFHIFSIVKQANVPIILYGRVVQIFKKCRNHLKILRVRKVTYSKFHYLVATNFRRHHAKRGCSVDMAHEICRLRLKCDGTRAETTFRLSAKRTSPFKSAGGVSSVDYWLPRCAHQR